jgi:hypothetical protein
MPLRSLSAVQEKNDLSKRADPVLFRNHNRTARSCSCERLVKVKRSSASQGRNSNKLVLSSTLYIRGLAWQNTLPPRLRDSRSIDTSAPMNSEPQ